MLVVRKEGKAHDQYNKFRSAFELMEAVGSEPCDNFSEMTDDLPPVEELEKRIMMQQEMLEKRIMMQHKALLADFHEIKTENSQLKAKTIQLEVENSQLKGENIDLRCRLEKLERRT